MRTTTNLRGWLRQGAPFATAALLLLALAPQSYSTAQSGGDEEKKEGEAGGEGEDSKKDDEAEAKYFAVLGGDVYTGNGGVLRGASILARNGVIQRIGYDLVLPEGTTTLEAKGLRVYPGLVAISASTRITQGGGAQAEEPEACCEEFDQSGHVHQEDAEPIPSGDPTHAEEPREDEQGSDSPPAQDDEPLAEEGGEEESGLADAYDPFSPFLAMTLASGITTVEQTNAAVKLKRDEIDGVVMREKYLSTFTWSSASAGKSELRKKFADAARYLREYRVWERRKDKDQKEPSKRGVDVKSLAVLEGKARAKFNANDREDLLGIARLAQEFGFRPVIEGCLEGWTVAEELGRAGAAAVIVPRSRRDKPENLQRLGGSSIENAAILHRHGVQVAVAPLTTGIDLGGIAGRDLMALNLEAAFAVRGGMSDEAALEAITIVPARLLGVEHRVGTIEVGKDCDLAVTDGDMLHYETLVQYAVVAGKVAYDKQKELFFAHIRPRETGEAAETPADAPKDEKSDGEGDEKGDGDSDSEKKDEKQDTPGDG